MDLHAILIRSPINRLARRVVAQDSCEDEQPLTKRELIEIVTRLIRKSQLLKAVLGIKGRAQHKNLMYATNKGWRNFRTEREPRAVVEYRRVGREIARMNEAMNALRQRAPKPDNRPAAAILQAEASAGSTGKDIDHAPST